MKKIFMMILILLLSSILFAGEPGSKAMTFLNIAPNPRVAALGESFTALADDVSAVYWNPAGISKLSDIEIAGNMNLYLESISYYNLQFAKPFGFGTLGVNIAMLSYGTIDKYENGSLIGSISPSDILFSAAYSKKLNDYMLIGANLKFISESLSDVYSGSGFGIDVGFLYNNPFAAKQSFLTPLNLGLVVQNLGVGPTFDKESNGLPLNIKFGLAYKYTFYRAVANLKVINFMLDCNVPTDAGLGIRYGTEAWWYNLANGLMDAAVRVGFRYPTDLGILSSMTFGAGIKMFNIQLDYALINYGDLGYTHRIGLLYRFGTKKKRREKE